MWERYLHLSIFFSKTVPYTFSQPTPISRDLQNQIDWAKRLRGITLISNDRIVRFYKSGLNSLQPKKGGRLQPMEYTQATAEMIRAFLRDITPREARGLVITTYRSTAITVSVIILQIPNNAPQKAYISQAARKEERRGEADLCQVKHVRI